MRIFLFIFLLFPAFLPAGEPAFLWKAVHPERPGGLYLAGSIHVGKPDMFPLDSVYDNSLKQADYVVFEIANPSYAKIMAFTMRHGVYEKNSGSLEQALCPDDFKKLAAEMRKLQAALTPARLSRMKPWIVFSIFSSLSARKLGFKEEYGLERVFLHAAGTRPKRSLENENIQLSALAKTDLEPEILVCLRDYIRNPEKADNDLLELVNSIKNTDDSVMIRQQKELKTQAPGVYQALMTDRNRAISDKLFDMLSEKKTGFVLVGLAHFIGEDNIREMLEKRGCKIVRLNKNGVPGNLLPNTMIQSAKPPASTGENKE